MARRGQRLIDLDRLVDLLHTHLTPALCRVVFGQVRINERQRAWTLNLLVQFWIAIVRTRPRP